MLFIISKFDYYFLSDSNFDDALHFVFKLSKSHVAYGTRNTSELTVDLHGMQVTRHSKKKLSNFSSYYWCDDQRIK